MTPPSVRGARAHTGRIPDDEEQLSFDLDALAAPRDLRVELRAGEPASRPGSSGPGIATPLDAVRVADLLGRPRPTPEQVAVIEAPVAPLLVVAGAGSGKTETMAARVVHLIATGRAAPQEILGLTFTRKAAAELADRIRVRLSALARKGFGLTDPHAVQQVTVSTYHAYAASLLTDHGVRLGLDGSTRLLGEAGAWQLVDDLVERWDGPMSAVEAARGTVVDAVLALAGECSEHLVELDAVDAELASIIDRVGELPATLGGAAPGRPAAPVRTVLNKLAARRQLLPLTAAYQRRKRELGVLDFGDQLALAARLALGVPEVVATERARYRVVLLDEYQDTSHAQLSLLRSLFGSGHPVTAVGDPHQSIYGWRGASAGNLQRFPSDFPAMDPVGGEQRDAAVTQLATSWRNDEAILAAANAVAGPLRLPASWAPHAPSVEVPPLRARDGAATGSVDVHWVATVEEEAVAVADFIENHWRAGSSTAVLCRARSQFPLVEAALRVRGLPVEVVGLGGLLHVPEVADLRATLEVVHDASRGDALMRLLTGAAWRIGAADLDALGAWARVVHRQSVASSGASSGRGGRVAVPEAAEELSLAAALDDLPPPDWCGPGDETLSPAGRERLGRLAEVLRHLRGRTGLPLPDLVLETERALLLDIEVAARPGCRPASARVNLDAFVDVAATFAETGDRPGLGPFLAWLAAAETEERGLEAPLGEVRTDAVQVLTVHAAKGLEWDAVAVPGMVEGTFPTGHAGRSPGRSTGWLTAGVSPALPFPLRGDVDSLPHWRVSAAGSQQELARVLEEFTEDCGAHEVAEERRLAYVALTRARSALLLSGAVWGDGSRPRRPSRFLAEVAGLAEESVPAITVSGWAQVEDGETNPRESLTRAVGWPVDPLGERRPAVEAAAALVDEAATLGGEAGAGATTGQAARRPDEWADEWSDEWADEVEALLAERDAGRSGRREVALPGHLSASAAVVLARDPGLLADRLRRPMPSEPSPATRRGSTFHAWLEQRFASAALVDVDELPGAADDLLDQAPDQVALDDLQRAFLASEWADLTPYAVEVSVETPVAGVMLRGRIDAVFRRPGSSTGEADRWDVVDWKTGSPTSDPAERTARAVQLAVYRLAWSALAGISPDQVGAAFFYAATGETVRPVDLLGADDLAALIAGAVGEG
ncbi:MAG: ATP-dependent helicase [Kineosporiaceae bacterium]|nr:ATP-dependent helicase [Kineosporiaceae bacterium]